MSSKSKQAEVNLNKFPKEKINKFYEKFKTKKGGSLPIPIKIPKNHPFTKIMRKPRYIPKPSDYGPQMYNSKFDGHRDMMPDENGMAIPKPNYQRPNRFNPPMPNFQRPNGFNQPVRFNSKYSGHRDMMPDENGFAVPKPRPGRMPNNGMSFQEQMFNMKDDARPQYPYPNENRAWGALIKRPPLPIYERFPNNSYANGPKMLQYRRLLNEFE